MSRLDALGAAYGAVAGAPLDPSPDRARTLLRRELLRPEYHDQNPVQQFLHWLGRKFSDGLDSASNASPIGGLGTILVFLALVLLLTWVLSRARRTPRAAESGAVLTDEPVTAADLRARARAALEAGSFADALVDGFRALTLRQIERGWIDDQPGATAHEVSVRLSAAFGDHADRIAASAALFDLVLYGDRPATREQAEGVLALEDLLATTAGVR